MAVAVAPQPKYDSGDGLLPVFECLCCTRSEPKDAIPHVMLLETHTSPPSMAQNCCFLSFSEQRVDGGVADVPEIRGLAGVTMQTDGGAENNVQTLKWAIFDKQRRTLRTRNVGGAVCLGMQSSQLATWLIALPSSSFGLCCWSTLMSMCARPCDFGYEFSFDETWRRADIAIVLNCCPCVPCVPAWCRCPSSLVKFEMVQDSTSTDGTHWMRNSSACGGPMKKSYELKEVFHVDGSPGRFHHLFAERAPQAYYMTR